MVSSSDLCRSSLAHPERLLLVLMRRPPQSCKFDDLSSTGGTITKDSELATSDSATLESTKDLVLGTRPDKDALIAELQEQIRRQLAKVREYLRRVCQQG